jgi:hypothetical protein
MGILKEPDGEDFYIKSRNLTEEEEKAISEYIAKWKIENKEQLSEKEKIKK